MFTLCPDYNIKKTPEFMSKFRIFLKGPTDKQSLLSDSR